MKSFKKIIALLLAVMLMIPVSALTASAAASPTKTSISTVATVTAPSVTYNGKNQTSAAVVTASNGVTLVEGVDYVITNVTAKSAGTYTVTVEGMGLYEGTITCSFVIKGIEEQEMTATVKKADTSFSSAALKTKAKTIKVTVTARKNAKITYTNVTKNKKIKNYVKVNKNGKITLKKGAKNGVYKIRVKVAAQGKYKKATRVVTIKKTSKKVTVKVGKK